MAFQRKGDPRWHAKVVRDGAQTSLGAHPTKRAAEKVEDAMRDRLDQLAGTAPMTLGVWLEQWLELEPRPSPRTNKLYFDSAKMFVDYFGPDTKLLLLREAHVKAWILKDEHQYRMSAVRQFFQDACHHGHLDRNPLAQTALKRRRNKQRMERNKQLPELTPAMLKDLLCAAATESEQVALMFRFNSIMGLRMAELSALRWDAIDFAAGTVRVTAQEDEYDRRLPKGQRPRKIRLLPEAREVLALVPRRLDSPYVFHTKHGVPWKPANMGEYFRRARRAANLPEYVQPRWLRSFATTRLRIAGADRLMLDHFLGEISNPDPLERDPNEEFAREQLGHANNTVQNRFYVQKWENELNAAIDELDPPPVAEVDDEDDDEGGAAGLVLVG